MLPAATGHFLEVEGRERFEGRAALVVDVASPGDELQFTRIGRKREGHGFGTERSGYQVVRTSAPKCQEERDSQKGRGGHRHANLLCASREGPLSRSAFSGTSCS